MGVTVHGYYEIPNEKQTNKYDFPSLQDPFRYTLNAYYSTFVVVSIFSKGSLYISIIGVKLLRLLGTLLTTRDVVTSVVYYCCVYIFIYTPLSNFVYNKMYCTC